MKLSQHFLVPSCPAVATGGDADSGLRFGAAGMQGWRTGMEDSHLACLDLHNEASPPATDPSKKIAAFAVFDGHVRPHWLRAFFLLFYCCCTNRVEFRNSSGTDSSSPALPLLGWQFWTAVSCVLFSGGSRCYILARSWCLVSSIVVSDREICRCSSGAEDLCRKSNFEIL